MQEIHLGLGLKRSGESEEIPFKGELIASPELLGTAVASQIGLTAGTVQNNDAGWLVFDFEGKTLLVAKKTLRHSLSWNVINIAGAVFGRSTFTTGGRVYLVRLLKGTKLEVSTGDNSHDPEQSWGSEWNRLFYPLVPNPSNTPTHPVSQEGIRYGEWAEYTEEDIGVGNQVAQGAGSWCQETNADAPTMRVYRGLTGVSRFIYNSSSGIYSGVGWRPVLELVRTTSEPQDLFLGEVSTDRLITGDALASQIGLTAGTAQNSTEPWLQFLTKEGQILYVAKKPYRSHISWDQIDAVNAVYGDREITIGNKRFKVRLLKGSSEDPYLGSNGMDPEQSWGSEWNRLFYPLVPNPTDTPTHPVSQEGITYGEWASYLEADLQLNTGNGRWGWCQETYATNQRGRIVRGQNGLAGTAGFISDSTASAFGWRPVLELIP